MNTYLTPCRQATCALLLLTGGFAAAGAVQAEQVKLPIEPESKNRQALELPRHGQSEASVRARFGSPEDSQGPVGEPPIKQWHYPDFVVYLEGDKVIHSVIRPEQQTNNR